MIAFAGFQYESGGGVLNFLQFVDEIERRSSQESVAVIKFREDKSADESVCSLNGKVLAD